MGLSKVLIVTNRPSIANSWAEDFKKFIDWRGELSFVSDTDALAGVKGMNRTAAEAVRAWAEQAENGKK